tara:strand:- start:39636 stop:40892 length:1257 start_codon:yes stop_codon:yes gene_type:complete
MGRMIKYVFTYLFFSCAFSQTINEKKLKKWIDQIPVFDECYVAIRVEGMNKIYADYNGSKYMTPASNTKLFTFLGAIQTFDSLPALEYKIENDTTVSFRSTGYPLLLHPFYSDSTLLNFLSQKKIWKYSKPKNRVKPYGPGWSWDDHNFYYAAEKSIFPIYGNSVKAIMGKKLVPDFFLELDSSVNKLQRNKTENKYYYNPDNWKVTDTIYSPFITSDSLFVNLLSRVTKNNIIYNNQNDSLQWSVLYTNNENKLYKALLHDSDNGIAESLLLMVSNRLSGRFSTVKAIEILKNKWGDVFKDDLIWYDGSGISRYNMFTPRTIIQVLKLIRKEIQWIEIKKLFPKSGESGTLLDYPSLKNIYAKTGTLRNNCNLSGFFENRKGKIIMFSVMVNHFNSPAVEIRNGIVEIVNKIQEKLE